VAPGPAQVHGSLYLRLVEAPGIESLGDCDCPEGRREGGVELPADPSFSFRLRDLLSDYEIEFTALGRLLTRLLPQRPPYKVVLDRTEWHFGSAPVNVLMVGIAHEGIAFPVSWRVLPDGGRSSTEDHRRALQRFFESVDPEDVEVMLGDREFISTEWLRWLQEREIPFAVRLRSDRRIGLSPEGPSLPARMFARPLSVHTEKVLDGTRHLFGTDQKHVEVQVVMRRIAACSSGEDQFLILVYPGRLAR